MEEMRIVDVVDIPGRGMVLLVKIENDDPKYIPATIKIPVGSTIVVANRNETDFEFTVKDVQVSFSIWGSLSIGVNILERVNAEDIEKDSVVYVKHEE
ncbi:hypothetical protein [Gorillibacterium sp. CAU 1737]|uniref:hypothetical protein n=1 Tax=Gorillibacterium sp. CAU 1737 TaxID=3140362 RepID=UPI0032608CA3